MKVANKSFMILYLVFSLFLMELCFRIAIDNNVVQVFSKGAIISFIFFLSISCLIITLGSLFQGEINFIILIIFLATFSFIYSSQLVYHDVFRTFYTIYSATQATQVFGFTNTILNTIGSNVTWILLMFLPVILFMLFGRKLFSFEKAKVSLLGFLLISFVLLHLSGLLFINNGDKKQNTAYDLYHNSSSPVVSVEKLGLITTMRIDVKRQLTNWSPVVETLSSAPVSSIVEEENDKSKREKEEESKGEVKENEEEIKTEYNVIDIDFDALITNEDDETIKEMHEYFKNTEPSEKNDYTGKFEGYNLILLTAEAFAPYAANKQVTPTLYKMVNEGYKFTDFYVPLWDVSTSDGEYVALNGLIPKPGVWSFSESSGNYLPFVMGNQFKKLGYKTLAYHNHTYNYYDRDISHPNMGYEYEGIGNGLELEVTWTASDLEMMEKTVDEYINDEPFHIYYMTVSGHLEYNFEWQAMALKNKKHVENLSFSNQAQAYLATQIELDKALEYLIDQLEKAEVMDNTLIVLSADHYPYGLNLETIDELTGDKVDQDFGIHKSDLIIYAEGMDNVIVDKPSSSLDIIPTISNLLGLEYDTRLLMGRDIFSETEPLVLFRDKSFITEKGTYNSVTGEFYPTSGALQVDEKYIESISSKVNQKFYYSSKILELDYYRLLFDE